MKKIEKLTLSTGFLEKMIDKMIDKYRCKKCGYLGKITIITFDPLDVICESCEREEKIDTILNK